MWTAPKQAPFVEVPPQQVRSPAAAAAQLPAQAEPFRMPEGPREAPAWTRSEPRIIRQPLVNIRMEDPSLPLPRFAPTTRKMRPAPIDAMEGLQRVKVTPQHLITVRLYVCALCALGDALTCAY
jgi:hypothetical protein